MSSEENKRIVTEGLERRKADRVAAEREAQLDSYEQDQLAAIHQNCADARLNREAEHSRYLQQQQRIARRQEWAAKAARAQMLEDKSVAAVRYYGVLCLVVLLISAVTKLPFWAAAALILGGAIFPVAYIFRLYNPVEE